MRIIFLLILIFLTFTFCKQTSIKRDAQKVSHIEFKEYISIIQDIKLNGQNSRYLKDLDYEAMLYLDKSALITFENLNKDFLISRDIDTSWIFAKTPSKQIKQIDIKNKNLRDFFSDSNNLLSLLTTLCSDWNASVDKDIYLLDSIAIFSISGRAWSSTYRMTRTNQQLNIEYLKGIME